MIEFLGDLPKEWKPNFDSLRIDFKRQPLLGQYFSAFGQYIG